MRFLQRLADRCDVNKMSSSNLAIVIGPTLLWPQNDQTYDILTDLCSHCRAQRELLAFNLHTFDQHFLQQLLVSFSHFAPET